jgi:NAD(P)-dependent dehydrogenase (short-subunit alcohol dehydrogenase family)
MNERRPNISSRLKGQVALVTGGGRGIGEAIAQTLASAGAAVAVLARSTSELSETVSLIERKGGRCFAVPADVTSTDRVREALHAVEKSLGPVDLLVNNAGTAKPLGPLWENDPAEWWRGMEVNLLGPLLCTRFVLPGMISRRRGRIINVSSGAGAMAMTYFSSYVCSKTALVRFTECLALEAEPYGIAAFSIAPGTVRTAMSEYSLNSPEGKKWLPWFKRLFDEDVVVPVERPAELVLELASGRADKLSGRFLSIHDDLDMLLEASHEIEQKNLYALKIERLGGGIPNPVVASILAEARKTAESTD